MVLILARKDDFTANMLKDHFKNLNIPCVLSNQMNKFQFGLTADCYGETWLSLQYGENTISSIINRGMATDEDTFNNSETTAAWWSVMASFKGPVINRPSRLGFLPFVESNVITKQLNYLQPARIVYSNTAAELAFEDDPLLTCNIHSAYNNKYLGHLVADSCLNDDEAYKFTGFNLDNTHSFLIAGDDHYCLSHPEGITSPEFEPVLTDIKTELQKYNANFYYLVLEDTEQGYCLTHTSPFPSYELYKHIADQVEHSLYKYLLS